MGLFSFKRKEEEPAERKMETTADEVSTPVSKERFIMEERVEKKELPIYGVYARLQEDWESKGYNDAKSFPETTYKENRKRVIIENLLLYISEVSSRYEDELTDIEECIERASKSGFIETLERYKQAKRMLVRHSDELKALTTDITEVGKRTKSILLSYDMGFARGVAAVGDDKVNNILHLN